MNIATLGVKIDPTEAVQGGRIASQAAESTAAAIRAADAKIEASQRGLAGTVKAASREVAQAARDTATAIESTAKAGAFDRIKSAAASMGTSAANAFRSLASGARDAANGLASAGVAAGVGAGGFGALLAAVGPLGIALGSIALVLAPLVAGFALLKSGIAAAAEFETMESQFAVLLGSFEKAEMRMSELKKFAASTPFELPDIVGASITLERFGGEALSTGKSLRAMGDASALAQQPIGEVALQVGRLYAGLKGGQAVGFYTQRLNEIGIVSIDTKNKIEEMTKSGNEGGKAFVALWGLVQADMAKADGQMKIMASTWNGIMSNISDAWNQTLASLGKPVMLALKPAAMELAEAIGQLEPVAQRVGEAIAAAVTKMHAAIEVLMQPGGFELTWNAAAATITATLSQAYTASGIVFDSVVARVGYELKKLIAEATEPGALKGFTDTLYNGAIEFKNAMLSGVREAYNIALPIATMMNPIAQALALGGKLAEWKPEALRVPTAATLGPKPDIIGPGEAWQQAASQAEVGPPRPESYAGQFLAQQARLAAIANAGRDNSLLPKQQAPGATGETIPTGIKAGTDRSIAAEAKRMESLRDSVLKSIETPSEKLAATMKQLESLRDAGMINMDQFARASEKASNDYLANIERMAEKSATPLQKLMQQWGDMKTNVQNLQVEMTQAISGNITRGLTDMANGTKTAKQAFDDMANGILQDIQAMIIKMLVQLAIQKALGFAVGAVTGVPMTVSAPVGVNHSGGTVGAGGMMRDVHPAAFSNASRYAVGGRVPGIGSGERAIIAEPGETVLTKAQAHDIRGRMEATQKGMKADSRKGGEGLTILNVMDMKQVEQHLARNPHVLLNVMSRERSRIKTMLG